MRRLIQRGLMFGNLIEVASPVLVERYNRALQHLTGKTTALEDFHIDISGFSPEIGDELGDPFYLNHSGVNRQFILLTTEQRTAPLLNAQFSTSRGILQQFIEANEAQLFALTARDAVAGELLNSVYGMSDPSALLDIRLIEVEADSTSGTVRDSVELGTMIDRFKLQDDAWFDDVLIAQMIGLAKKTGDVTRNPVKLRDMSFKQDSFWTAHFGGIYLFRDVPHPAAITVGRIEDKLMDYQFELSQANEIAVFLELNGLAEPIVKAPGIDAATILQRKMEFIVAHVAAAQGEALERISAGRIRGLTRQYAAELPAEFKGLAALLRWATSGGAWPRISSDHPAYFYTLRASEGPYADLVNMLLAELAPLDVLQLFICHKDAFYSAYAGWPEPFKDYVARFLEQSYQSDKAATREALFGHEATVPLPPEQEELIELVGPWGALKR
ncbi:DUF6638 family protein [Algirhabdus cladophorae]|uniref:DUF6638 family protein n=1 Tax=Algirhabdus cladophorae TaxID=3377108 RepID=UPI003B8476F9